MSVLTAKISLNNESPITNADLSYGGVSNISQNINGVLNKRTRGKRTFMLKSTKLGEGYPYSNIVPYYVSGIASDIDGNFGTPIKIVFNNFTNSFLSIVFDTINNQFPKFILVNGKKVVDDDAVYVIGNIQTNGNTLTIEIPNWTAPNSPAIIQGIYSNISIDINNNNLLSFTDSINDRTDTTKPCFGLISNKGSIKIKDFDGEINDYLNVGLLKQNVPIVAYIECGNKKQIICNKLVDRWQYDNVSKEVDINFKDSLQNLQEIKLQGDGTLGTSRFYKTLYEAFFESISGLSTFINRYTPYSFSPNDLSEQQKEHLRSINIPRFYKEEESLWARFQKYCELAGVYAYVGLDSSGNPKIKLRFEKEN